MTREQKMLAVVEAAREALTSLRNTRTNIMVAEKYDARWAGVAELLKPRIDALANALADLEPLAALDAHTAADAETVDVGKVVQIAVCQADSDGGGCLYALTSDGRLFSRRPASDAPWEEQTTPATVTREGGR